MENIHTSTHPVDHSSRRSMLKRIAASTAGLVGVSGIVGGGIYLSQTGQSASAHYATNNDDVNKKRIQDIMNIAATAEALGVVFYTRVLANANKLGLKPASRSNIQAALTEEQVHLKFLLAHGAKQLTTKFSFPYGADTFTNLDKFLKTQQQLEAAFVAAYLAAVKEFSQVNRPDLAQIAAQIAAVEGEHRVIGRTIGAMSPANNVAFEKVTFNKVADAATALKNAGFLKPAGKNSYQYNQANTTMAGVDVAMPVIVGAQPMHF